jgi:plastocyanin
MKKINLFYGVVAIIILGGILWYVNSQNGGMLPSGGSPSSTIETQTEQPASNTTGGNGSQTGGAGKPTQANSSIQITSPADGAQWVTGENHTIAWTKEAGITGSIYLADAATGQTVGWILSNISMHQTSVVWGTDSVFTLRGGGLKRSVPVGHYVVKIKFDGTAFPVIQSGAFSVVYAGEITYATYMVSIKNFAMNPATLSVKSGDTVIVVNNDAVVHHLLPIGFGEPYTLQPGGSVTLAMKNIAPGSYGYYSPDYASLKLAFTVK